MPGDLTNQHRFAKPPMVLSSESKYPSRRAYVIKVRSDARSDALAGRLENLVTGRQHEFVSGAELLEAIANDLVADRVGSAPGSEPRDGSAR